MKVGYQQFNGGAAHVSDVIDIEGKQQASLAISGSGAQSSALAEGIYDVWSDVDCYLKVAGTANDVTTATGYLLRAGNTVPVYVRDQSKIGAVTAGPTGTLRLHQVRS